VNGKEVDFDGATLYDLVIKYNLNPEGIVVERNSIIIHRESYREVRPMEGDRIEIVTFVGGG